MLQTTRPRSTWLYGLIVGAASLCDLSGRLLGRFRRNDLAFQRGVGAGQVAGCGIGLAGLASSALLLWSGHGAIGLAIGTTALGIPWACAAWTSRLHQNEQQHAD